jgi:purine nucleosidase
MVGLDATHQALATPDVVDRIRAIGNARSAFVVELLEFFGATYEAQQGFPHPPVHDPCAVAYVIDPRVLQTVRVPIAIELTGTHTLGMTVADLRRPAPADCATSAATGLDRDRFWDLVVRSLQD